jgi:hypothetical protein
MAGKCSGVIYHPQKGHLDSSCGSTRLAILRGMSGEDEVANPTIVATLADWGMASKNKEAVVAGDMAMPLSSM